MARGRMFDVPWHESGPALAGTALRIDVEPELRGAAGSWRPHPPHVASDGCRGCLGGRDRRCEGLRMLKSFDRLSAVAAPLAVENVDTDCILPGRFLSPISRDGRGEAMLIGRAAWKGKGVQYGEV